MLSFFLKVLLLFLLVLMSAVLFNDGELLQCTHIFFFTFCRQVAVLLSAVISVFLVLLS